MASKLKLAIGGVIICTLFTAFGQLFLKMGADRFVLETLLLNWPLLVGIILYGLGAVLLVVCLKHGELSILYPFLALSYIWVMLLSISVLTETVSITNWIGVGFLIGGVSFVGLGAK